MHCLFYSTQTKVFYIILLKLIDPVIWENLNYFRINSSTWKSFTVHVHSVKALFKLKKFAIIKLKIYLINNYPCYFYPCRCTIEKLYSIRNNFVMYWLRRSVCICQIHRRGNQFQRLKTQRKKQKVKLKMIVRITGKCSRRHRNLDSRIILKQKSRKVI